MLLLIGRALQWDQFQRRCFYIGCQVLLHAMVSSMRPNNPLPPPPLPTHTCDIQITKPSEVRSLSPLRSLLSLTLASNPVDSKPKAMRTLCMGLLPSLTSLDGVKIIRVASVRSPAKSYSQLYSRGGITPGMKGGNSKKQKAAGKNSNLVDLQPLFTIKPSGSSSGSTMPSGSFPVHHQIKECNIEGVSYSPRQWLENILQDSADLHGLQVTAAPNPSSQSPCKTSSKHILMEESHQGAKCSAARIPSRCRSGSCSRRPQSPGPRCPQPRQMTGGGAMSTCVRLNCPGGPRLQRLRTCGASRLQRTSTPPRRNTPT